MRRSYGSQTRLLNFLSTLNLLPCLLEFIWAMFVIVIYTNPEIPPMRWSAGVINEPGIHALFVSHDKYVLICNALRIIALVYVFFQIASLIIGFISVKKPQCVKIWRALCIINFFLGLISTNVISAGITAIIFAKLYDTRKSPVLSQ